MKKAIIDIVCFEFGVTKDELYDNMMNRISQYLLPRTIAIFFIKHYTRESLTDIGLEFCKNHSTVLNSINRASNEMYTDKNIMDVSYKINKRIVNELKPSDIPVIKELEHCLDYQKDKIETMIISVYGKAKNEKVQSILNDYE